MIRLLIDGCQPYAPLALQTSGGIAALALAAAAVVGLLVGLAIGWARRLRDEEEVRELVRSIEELRSGAWTRNPAVARDSALTWIADALRRLHDDVASRWREVEGASDRLEAVLGAIPDLAVVTIDEDGDVTSVGSGSAGILGYEEPDLVGKPLARLFDEDGWREFLPKLSRKVLRVRGVETSARLRRADGRSFAAKVALRGLLDPRGRLNGFLLILREDEIRSDIERALRETEARYARLLEQLDQPVMIVDAGVVEFANPALAGLLDLPLERLTGTPWRERVASEDVLLLRSTLDRAPDGDAERLELDLRLRGEIPPRALRLRAHAIRRDGTFAWLCTLTPREGEGAADGTVDRDALAALRRASPGIVWLGASGADRVVRWAGALAGELFGTRPEAGVRWDAWLERDDDGTRRVAAWWSGERAESHVEFVRDGVRRSFELEWVDLDPRSGVLRFRDSAETAMREAEWRSAVETAEAALAERNDRLERLRARAEELESLCGELRKLDDMKSRLLGNVSHELQTPLVSIRGFTEMILKERLGPLNEEQKKGLRVSLKGIDRLIKMIEGLSGFSTPGSEADRPRLSVWPLRALIEEIAALQSQDREAKGLAFHLSMERPDAHVEGDRDRIAQVFINLLNNATKYNVDGGWIEVRVRPGSPGMWAVEIEDTGPGIPDDKLQTIFEPRERARHTDETSGRGLGLSIVRDLLRLHGCEIRVRNARGRGSVFEFGLPAAEVERADDEAAERADEGSVRGADPIEGREGEATTRADRDPWVDDVRREPPTQRMQPREASPDESPAEILEAIDVETTDSRPLRDEGDGSMALDVDALLEELARESPGASGTDAPASPERAPEAPRRTPKRLLEKPRFRVLRPDDDRDK